MGKASPRRKGGSSGRVASMLEPRSHDVQSAPGRIGPARSVIQMLSSASVPIEDVLGGLPQNLMWQGII
jgi:hypothetical protein